MATCSTPGCFRDTGADWKTLCPRCWARKRQAEEDDPNNLQARCEALGAEVAELKAALKKVLGDSARVLSGGGGGVRLSIPEDKLRLLLQLCHPDKHDGSAAANKATSWLNSLKDKGGS